MGLQSGPAQGQFGRPPAIRTLVLDDSGFDRKRIVRLGGKVDLPMTFAEASSVDAMKQCLDQQTFDLFLIDYRMPDGDGLAALEVIRNHPSHRGAAAIMISGAADSKVAVTAMKRGCRDVIAKEDMSPELLHRAVIEALHDAPRFARPFARTGPGLDVDTLRGLMKQALDDKTIRDILREPLEEGLRAAAQMIAREMGMQASPALQDFLIDFTREDEFCFR